MATDHPFIFVFSAGTRYELTATGTDANSYFGGPNQDYIHDDKLLRHCQLHHIATLNHPRLGIGSVKFGFSISLYYGLTHEGCVLSYHRTATSAVQFTHLEPKKLTPNYPYPGYPPLLPYYRLGIASTSQYTKEEIQSRIYNTGWSVRDDCVYVIVCQHPHLGVCLFDPSDEVEIVFEYDHENGRVKATNQCS